MTWAAELGHLQTKQADGAGSDHGNGVAGTNARLHHHRVVSHAARLGEGSTIECHSFRDTVQATRRNADVFGHRAVHSIAESHALGTEVVLARPAINTGSANH